MLRVSYNGQGDACYVPLYSGSLPGDLGPVTPTQPNLTELNKMEVKRTMRASLAPHRGDR